VCEFPCSDCVDSIVVVTLFVLMDVGSAARGEMSAKTTYQRAAKGSIAVSECPPDGKFIRLENTGRKVATNTR